MKSFITISQTPVYKVMPNGAYNFVRSLVSGTELSFARTGVDPLSKRQVGFFSNGEVMYLDALSPLLEETEVRSTRLWDWLIVIVLILIVALLLYLKFRRK